MIESPIPIVRGEEQACLSWLSQPGGKRSLTCLVIIFAGCGLYGGAIGSWRAPEMALFTAAKLPLLIYLTLLANGLINGILAQVLGSGLTFGQTLQSQLMSYMVFALILGALSPVAFAMALTAPEPDSAEAHAAHRFQMLAHTGTIAYAGIVSNYKLFRMLRIVTGSRALALRTLLAWLAGNLFVGAQLSWNLRPFFGSPHLPVQFLRPDPFDGNFYESIFRAILTNIGL